MAAGFLLIVIAMSLTIKYEVAPGEGDIILGMNHVAKPPSPRKDILLNLCGGSLLVSSTYIGLKVLPHHFILIFTIFVVLVGWIVVTSKCLTLWYEHFGYDKKIFRQIALLAYPIIWCLSYIFMKLAVAFRLIDCPYFR